MWASEDAVLIAVNRLGGHKMGTVQWGEPLR